MYSTKLNPDMQRYVAKCIVNNKGPKFVDFVVDTGAKYTCASYMSINPKLLEEDFQDAESKTIGGIVTGQIMTIYHYHINQFTIGTVDLGERDIWITFDKRVSDDVLGMDILSDVFIFQNPEIRTLIFSKDTII